MHRVLILLWVLCLPGLVYADQISVQLVQDVYRADDADQGRVHVVVEIVNQGPGSLENAIVDMALPASADARPAGARRADRLFWPVGVLQDGDRASVSFSIPVTEVPAEGIAAHLRGTVGGKANHWTSRALKMEPASFPVALLASTADADATDPIVRHQAAVLGNDPEAIFRFVRDQIQHQPYGGSLHGARGVLYGGGANRIDRSNALVAMLRASGVPARYRTGSLSTSRKEELGRALISQVQGMSVGALSVAALKEAPRTALQDMLPDAAFDLGLTMSERIAAVQSLSEEDLERLTRVTLHDPRVQAYMNAEHVYVEAYVDGAWIALEPSFSTAQMGERFATGGQTLDGVPEAWRHRVALRIYHETMTTLSGFNLATQAPTIERTVGAGDLVGRHLVATHRIESQDAAGMIFASSSRTFTPSIQIRDVERLGTFETLETTSFTELFSSFGGGIANTVVTGVWLEVELMAPGQDPGQGDAYVQAMADRIGFEGRNGEPVSLTSEDFEKLLMDRLDVTTLMVQASHVPLRVARSTRQILETTREAVQPTAEEVMTLPQSDPVTNETVEQATEFMRQFTSSLLGGYSGRMAERSQALAGGHGVIAYTPQPRVIAATGRVSPDVYPSVVIDLMSEKMLGLPQAGFPASSSYFFAASYGLAASELESALLQTVQGAHVISTDVIFAKAGEQSIELQSLKGQSGLLRAERISMSNEARIRVRQALLAGKLVIIPAESILFDGEQRIAWFEADDDGHIIGRLDSGAGGAAIQYATMLKSLVCSFLVPCLATDKYTIMANMGAANGYLWGMIMTVVDFVAVCTSSALDCNKLTNPAFEAAVTDVMQHTIKALALQDEPASGWDCNYSYFSFAGDASDFLEELTGVPGLPGEIKGACATVMAFAYSISTIKAALSDPVLPSRTTGTMDPERGDARDRYTATRRVGVPATISPTPISGTAPYEHVRFTGQVQVSWSSEAAHPLLAEDLRASGSVSVDAQSLGTDASWVGALNTLSVAQRTPWNVAGVGVFDGYGNDAAGLALVGAFDEVSAVSFGASEIDLDTRMQAGELAARAGSLTIDNTPAQPGTVAIDASSAETTFQYFAALDASTTLTLTNAAGCADLSGPGISRGGVALGAELLSFANAAGTATLTREEGVDQLSLAFAEADVASLSVSQPFLTGFGRKAIAFGIQSSLATDFDVSLRAPQGVRVGFVDDQSFYVEPGAAMADGTYVIELTARSPEGFCLSAALPYHFALPAEPVVSLRAVEDTRYTIDDGGVRFPSRLLDLTHWGREPGTYTLTASVNDPRLDVTLGNDGLTLKPGESVRTGLVVRRADGEPWPPAGTAFEIRIDVDGTAQAELRIGETMAASPGVRLLGPEGLVVTEPGRTLSLTYYVESTGNVAANAVLDVSTRPSVPTRFTQPHGAILPGAVRAVVVEFDVPAMQDLPQHIDLSVALRPTPFELERELEPRAHHLRVNVYPSGLTGLATVAIDAQNDQNYALMGSVGRVLLAGTEAASSCDADAIDRLIAALDALRTAFANDSDAADFVSNIDTLIRALETEGCDAIGGLADISSDVLDIAQRPNLAAVITSAPSVINGTPHTFTLQVHNTGGSEAPVHAATLSIRRGAQASTLLERYDVPALGPGDFFETSFIWDTTTALGTYVAELRVDVDAVVSETTKTDNLRLAVVEVLANDAAPQGNQPPSFQSLPVTLATAGSPYTYTPTVVDPDADQVFLNAPVRPPGVTLQGETLSGIVPRPGTYPVVLVALDRYGAFTEQSFDLVVSEFGIENHAPRVTSTPNRQAVVGQGWIYDITAIDEEGDELSFFDDTLPSGMALTPTPEGARLSWTPTEDDPGTHWVSLRVVDEGGAETRHRFSIVVRETPLGPDLNIARIDLSDVIATTVRVGDARVTIVNAGDAPSGQTDLILWEERDFLPGRSPEDVLAGSAGVLPLEPGESIEIAVPVSGEVAFAGNILYAMVDPLDVIEESKEDNNIRHSMEVDPPLVGTYVGFQDEPNDLVLLAHRKTPFRVVDPATDETIEEGILEALLPTYVPLEIDDGGNGLPLLDVFVVEADGPIQVYQSYEQLFENFGGDMFHVDLEGQRIGREFAIYLPTLTVNNRLIITALEPGVVSLYDDLGNLLDSLALITGQPWEPTVFEPFQVYRITSTADVTVHSASVTGMSVVPPANRLRAAMGDVGREFRFNTRARGPNGGAVAVFGYENASYTITTEAGVVLVNQTIGVGEHRFHYSLGENLGLVLRSTGDVMVLSGDIARSGASTIDLMGEDITTVFGDAGRDIRVHALQNDLGPSAILAGPRGAALQVNGVTSALPPFGRMALSSSQMHRILASEPVSVRLFGGGDRYFDYGDVLREAPSQVPAAHPVLDRFILDIAHCGAGIEASVRVGNAGSGTLPADVRLELIELGVDGEVLVVDRALETNLAPGQWQDVTLTGTTQTSGATQRTWLVRLSNLPAGSPPAWTNGGTFEIADCQDAPPYFVTTPPSSVVSGAQLVYLAEAMDPEGLPVTYRLIQGPAGATIGRTSGALEWIASADANTLSFAIEAGDPAGNVAIQTFALDLQFESFPCVDNDGDGYCDDVDCDDNDPTVHPGAVEILGDGIDNDCNPSTVDVPLPGTVHLATYTGSASYDVHDAVEIFVVFTNQSPITGVGAGTAEVVVTCGGLQAMEETMAAPALTAGTARTLRMTFEPNGFYEGRCNVGVQWLAATEVLAAAGTTFELGTSVAGFLEAENLGTGIAHLAWRLENRVERGLDVQMTLASGSIAGPLFEDIVSLAPAGSAHGTHTIDVTGFAPGLYSITLSVDGVVVARAPLVIGAHAHLEAVAMEASDTLGRSVPVDFQPLGPRLGGRRAGGVLRAGWTADSLTIELDTVDVTADDDDLVVFRIMYQGTLREVVWVNGVFAGDIDGALRETPEGARAFTFALGAGQTTHQGGDAFAVFALIRDGSAQLPRGIWAFATDISETYEDPDAFGLLTLLDAELGPDPDPDPDPEPDPNPDPDPDPEPDPEPDPDPNPDPDPDPNPDPEPDPNPGDDPGDDPGLDHPDTVAGGCGCSTPAAPVGQRPALILAMMIFFGLLLRRQGGKR